MVATIETGWFIARSCSNGAVALGTPVDYAKRVNEALNKVLASPEVKTKLFEQGFELQPGSREDFGRFIAKDLAIWAKAIKDANHKID